MSPFILIHPIFIVLHHIAVALQHTLILSVFGLPESEWSLPCAWCLMTSFSQVVFAQYRHAYTGDKQICILCCL